MKPTIKPIQWQTIKSTRGDFLRGKVGDTPVFSIKPSPYEEDEFILTASIPREIKIAVSNKAEGQRTASAILRDFIMDAVQ